MKYWRPLTYVEVNTKGRVVENSFHINPTQAHQSISDRFDFYAKGGQGMKRHIDVKENGLKWEIGTI